MSNKTTPTPYTDLRDAIEVAVVEFERFAVPDWAGWIVYMLEALQDEAAGRGDFDAVLESVETAIAIRRAGGSW